MYDSVIDPFGPLTHEQDYLDIDERFSEVEEDGDDEFVFKIHFELQPEIQILQRTRYSFWDALGDIGGFHDGLALLISFFMSSISSALFTKELEKSGRVDKTPELTKTEIVAQTRLARLLSSESQHMQIKENYLRLFLKTFDFSKIQSSSVMHVVGDFLCRGRRRARQRQFNYFKQLDIQQIIANSLSYRAFIRSFLTPSQRVLLDNQRSRLISYDGNTCSSESDNSKQNPTTVTQVLSGFTPTNRFERQLLLGILFKKGRVPEGQGAPATQLLTQESVK